MGRRRAGRSKKEKVRSEDARRRGRDLRDFRELRDLRDFRGKGKRPIFTSKN
jgi:hypothetical protein